MLNHSLIFLALMSFSVASNAAAIPMDANLAAVDAKPNAILHKKAIEVCAYQTMSPCSADAICTDKNVSLVNANSPVMNDWFAVQDDASALQPLGVLLLIIGLIMLFLSRNPSSTK